MTQKKKPTKKAPVKKKTTSTPKTKPAFKPNAKDGDGDGVVQDGTPWARPVGTELIVPKSFGSSFGEPVTPKAVQPAKKKNWLKRLFGR